MVNRVVLVGRLTRDPELRRTNSGLQVTSFTLAFTNRTKNADGTSSSSFVTCTAWNKMAEIISQYCKKGSQLCVDGRLQENKYQRKDGTNASTVEIVVENIELLGKKKSRARDLSGGQKQRLAVARAIVSNPRILFADEPTGNLDSATGVVVEDLLFGYNKDNDVTLIIVTHDPDLAKRCDIQIHIKDGKIESIEGMK